MSPTFTHRGGYYTHGAVEHARLNPEDGAKVEAWLDDHIEGWRDKRITDLTVCEGPPFTYTRVLGWTDGLGLLTKECQGVALYPFPLEAVIR